MAAIFKMAAGAVYFSWKSGYIVVFKDIRRLKILQKELIHAVFEYYMHILINIHCDILMNINERH